MEARYRFWSDVNQTGFAEALVEAGAEFRIEGYVIVASEGHASLAGEWGGTLETGERDVEEGGEKGEGRRQAARKVSGGDGPTVPHALDDGAKRGGWRLPIASRYIAS